VVSAAAFKAGLRRFDVDGAGAPWRPEWICYYFINDAIEPSFALDVSDFYGQKRRALACYRSQFSPADPDSVPTRLTASSFMSMVESRDALLGARTGVAYAEGVLVRDPVLRPHLMKDWRA
jgi:LmbE family N-acetylglucosaminyl deacetylase